LVADLTEEIPADQLERTEEQRARWLLAQLLDWHRRENKSTHWEGFRLADLDDQELLEERAGLGRLKFVKRLVQKSIPTDLYSFEMQEWDTRSESDVYYKGKKLGTVVSIDLIAGTVEIKKTQASAGVHPTAVYAWDF